MVAGALSKAGYFMGDNLLPSNEHNPKGFFESRNINDINNMLLAPVVKEKSHFWHRWLLISRPGYQRLWLATVPLGTHINPVPQAVERIKRMTQQEPFCFKDPRFSYTLDVWRPYLQNTVFVCIFREPTATANSMIKEGALPGFIYGQDARFKLALRIWTLMYMHILEHFYQGGEWLFLHYKQVISGEGINSLQHFTGCSIDRSFPDPTLQRSRSTEKRHIPWLTQFLYQRLCTLSGYA
jgi:hypothetical protein